MADLMNEHVFEHDGATYTVRADNTISVAVPAGQRASGNAAVAMGTEILRLANELAAERARARAALLEGVDALGVLGEPGLIDAGDVRELINRILPGEG